MTHRHAEADSVTDGLSDDEARDVVDAFGGIITMSAEKVAWMLGECAALEPDDPEVSPQKLVGRAWMFAADAVHGLALMLDTEPEQVLQQTLDHFAHDHNSEDECLALFDKPPSEIGPICARCGQQNTEAVEVGLTEAGLTLFACPPGQCVPEVDD
jgi:hypothetical protein